MSKSTGHAMAMVASLFTSTIDYSAGICVARVPWFVAGLDLLLGAADFLFHGLVAVGAGADADVG